MEGLPVFEFKANPSFWPDFSKPPVIKGYEYFSFDQRIPNPETYQIPDFFNKNKQLK